VKSAEIEKSPQHVYFVNNCSYDVIDNICHCDAFVTNQLFFRSDKIENNVKDFCFVG